MSYLIFPMAVIDHRLDHSGVARNGQRVKRPGAVTRDQRPDLRTVYYVDDEPETTRELRRLDAAQRPRITDRPGTVFRVSYANEQIILKQLYAEARA